MKKLMKNKKRIVFGIVIVLLAFVIIIIFCLKAINNSENKNQDLSQSDLQEDTLIDDNDEHSSEGIDEEVSKEQEPSNSKNYYDDIFGEQPNVTETDNPTEDKSENQTNNKDDGDNTTTEQPKENLEESEDTSTGYGPIS